MFYANYVLLKKGPLARIWLAAHWEKKLTKAQIYDTDIDKAVDYILEPKIRMALRTTGHLLLGVVKIYFRKTKYLLADCTDTCTRMRLAFRPYAIVVDLPENQAVAPFDAITYPEVFHNFDSSGLDISLNQSRYEDITLAEDVAMPPAGMYNTDNAYGFCEEEDIEQRRGASLAQADSGDIGNLRFSVDGRKSSGLGANASANQIDLCQFIGDDGAAAERMDVEAQQHPVTAEQDQPPPPFDVPVSSSPIRERSRTPAAPVSPFPVPSADPRPSDVHGMTTLLSNTRDGIVLAPLDEATLLGRSGQRGLNRKRRHRLVVDLEKSIPPEKMKKIISNYKDTMRPLDLAPDTKRKMRIKELNIVEHLFTFPCIELGSTLVSQVFRKNLKTRQRTDEQEIGCGITLVEDIPMQIDPIVEDVELERNQAAQGCDVIDEVERHTVVQPPALPPIPEEMGESPQGTENIPPAPYLDLIAGSPFGMDANIIEAQQPGFLTQRNSSTPIRTSVNANKIQPQELSPLKQNEQGSNKNQALERSQLIQNQEDGQQSHSEVERSHGNRLSVTWNAKARDILVKLKELAVDQVFSQEANPSQLTFADLISRRDTRKSVARSFYALLELKRAGAVNVKQDEPYGDITISTGPAFFDNSNM